MGDNFNPYEAPRADGQAYPQPVFEGDLQDASRGIRFANFVIDSVLRTVLAGVMGFVAGTAKMPLLALPLGLGSVLGYYLVFEALFQATPGKMITNTRVVDMGGAKPSFGQILGRTLSRFVPFEPFSFFSSTRDGWHDRWSGTRVVRR